MNDHLQEHEAYTCSSAKLWYVIYPLLVIHTPVTLLGQMPSSSLRPEIPESARCIRRARAEKEKAKPKGSILE